MNLRWKVFEQRLGKKVREYDARRRMTFWQRINHLLNSSLHVPLWCPRGIFTLVVTGTVLSNVNAVLAFPEVSVACIGFWGLVVAVARVGLVLNTAATNPEYRTLWMLPLSGTSIFHHLLRPVIWGAIWVFLEFLFVYAVLATGSQSLFASLAGAVICAALQAAFSVTLTLLLVSLKVRPDRILGPLLFLGWFFLFISCWPQTMGVLANALNRINPCGWLNVVYVGVWLRGDAHGWVGLLPVFAVSATLPFSLRSLRRQHYQGAFRIASYRGGDLFSAPKQERLPKAESQAEQSGRVLGDSARPLTWTEYGPVERLIHRVLNPRELIISEMLLPAHPRWSNLLLGFVTYYALYLAVSTQIQFASLEALLISIIQGSQGAAVTAVASIACLVFFVMMLANGLFLFTWFGALEPALNPASTSTPAYTTFRLFPASYWDTARAIAKINSLVALLLFPPAFLFSFTPACQMVLHDVARHPAIMPKCLVLLWGVTLHMLSLKLTPSIQNGLKYWRSALKKLVVSAGLTGLGAALLVSPEPMLDCLLALVFILSALAWFLYSGAQYCKFACSHWLRC